MTDQADLFDPIAHGSDAFPEFARRRSSGGASWGKPPYPEVGEAFYVFSHALVSQALKHPLLLQAPPGAYQEVRQKISANPALDLLTRSMLLSDPPRHMRLRRPLAGSLSFSSSNGLFDRLAAKASELTQAAVQKPEFDAVRDIGLPLSFSALEQILGIDMADPWRIGADAQLMANALEIRAGGVDEDANDACRRLEAWVSSVIEHGTVRPNGISAQMLAEVEAGRWLRDDAVANIVFLLFAGQATVVDTFGNALVALARFPEQLSLLEDGKVSWFSAAEELLRFCAPVHYAGARIAAEDMQFGGATIKAGQAVVPVLASANRDISVFPAGDRLDLGSGISSALAFGTGLHACLGQHVARLEIAVLLEALFTQAKGWCLDLPRVVRRHSVLFHGLQAAPFIRPADQPSV
ncbi:cytochrome P450 [Mesorhizobium sp. M7A.F.Ca.CA.004.11.2.1]|uniref:cytochrome P450 n=1 Tax=Mesorhizobium sp. M7A.F.Ca.CA.004.11.2.1 TaxID=2496699 RepID=UPI000FCCB706|nr:cytochrome P450 [Mesorhizobium sp. M7A.F.Ca.CA.004.11.2.1]RVA24842.1 cytochrome P450 [Mesorhizobium sp. M7A.F.Ca.CA.004.11.2.1]